MSPGEEVMMRKLCQSLVAVNVNLTDIAKSLRALVEQGWKKEKPVDCDRWRMAIGPEAELPNEDYDWVLVKIRDSQLRLPGSAAWVYTVPHIAEYRNGTWWAQELDQPYESDEIPFEVVQWRPIPGDEVEKLYVENEEIVRNHRYE